LRGRAAWWTAPTPLFSCSTQADRTKGLRIADASVMPTIPSANTNAPSIMIGEFASRVLFAG
jgi:choline dehydrogenase